jgi:hypothetical protein
MQAAGRDVEQGSYSALWAATSPEIEEKTLQGYYFIDPVRSRLFRPKAGFGKLLTPMA